MTQHRRYLLFLSLFLTLPLLCLAQQPTIKAVVNGASYSGNLAPGTWAAMFGTNLALNTAPATSVPLPTQLGGASVTVGGIPSPLFYASPTQINLIVPFELTPTTFFNTVPVVVTTAAGTSASFNVALSKDSPGVFALNGGGSGAAIAFDGTFSPVTTVGNAPIILYAAGLGQTTPPAVTSSGGASSEPLNRIQDDLSVFIGEKKATISFAGLAPGLPGIYQINVVPNGAVSDRLYLQVGGWQSNLTTLPISIGEDVTNVIGSIDGLYPTTGANASLIGVTGQPQITFSAFLTAANFKATFDILPSAQPFSIVATSEGGTAIISIDPIAKTWSASVSSPSANARKGVFTNTEYAIVRDFVTCLPTTACNPMPLNVIPTSRLDAASLVALSKLALPDTVSAGGVNGVRTASGTFSGTHFDSSLLGDLVNFGGFVQIAHPGPSARITTFRLYIDGKLVASTDAGYPVP